MTSMQARAYTTLPARKHPGLLLRGERHLQATCSQLPLAHPLRTEQSLPMAQVGLHQKVRAGSLACHCQDHLLGLLRLARGHKVSTATLPAPHDRTVSTLTMARPHPHHKDGLPRRLLHLAQYRPLRPTGMRMMTSRLPSDQSSRNAAVTPLRTSLSGSTLALTAMPRQLLGLRGEMQAQTACGNVGRKAVLREMVPAAAISCHPSVTNPGQATSSLLLRKVPSVNVAKTCGKSQGMPVFPLCP